ncbi:hypothetical protein BG011_003244, partial [Mortierella polycephala]
MLRARFQNPHLTLTLRAAAHKCIRRQGEDVNAFCMRYVAIADQIPDKTDVDKMLELIAKLPAGLANKLRDKLHTIDSLYELVNLAGRLSQSHESWTLFAPPQRAPGPSRPSPYSHGPEHRHHSAPAMAPTPDDMAMDLTAMQARGFTSEELELAAMQTRAFTSQTR